MVIQPQAREVELFIDIKNMTTIKDTNYNNFARYFSKLQDASTESTGNKETDSSFTESDFEASVKRLEDELNHVIENLKISESISHQLMEQEFGLRDVNEAIYEGYTMISCIMLACIVFFGIFQLSYQRWYLKRKNVI